MNSSYIYQRTFRVLIGTRPIGLKTHGVGLTVLTIATHFSPRSSYQYQFRWVSDIIQQAVRMDLIMVVLGNEGTEACSPTGTLHFLPWWGF